MNIKSLLALCAASGALVGGPSAVLAGGAVAPIVDVAPIEVAPAPVIGAWEGAYAGGALGYSFTGDDEVGLQSLVDGSPIGRATGLTNLKLSGVTVGAHIGYRWQRDRWVFGPELAIEGGSVNDSGSFTFEGSDASAKSEINSVISLVMKTGYTVDPQTIVFGTFGVARADADYTLTLGGESTTEGYSATGLTAGFGVERMINETTSIFGAYQYRDFGRSNVDFDDAGTTRRTVAIPKHSNIKVGVSFKF